MADSCDLVSSFLDTPADQRKSMDLCKRLCETIYDWQYGDTSCGSYIIQKHLIPKAKKALKHINKGEWSEGLINLVGISLFLSMDEGQGVLRDNEAYMEQKKFNSIFDNLSEAWRLALEHRMVNAPDDQNDAIGVIETLFGDLNLLLTDIYGPIDEDNVPQLSLSVKDTSGSKGKKYGDE